MPVFDDAADAVSKAGYDNGKVVMGKVDCDKEAAIATRFHITKYPTLKLFRNGLPAKKEYRGEKKCLISQFVPPKCIHLLLSHYKNRYLDQIHNIEDNLWLRDYHCMIKYSSKLKMK